MSLHTEAASSLSLTLHPPLPEFQRASKAEGRRRNAEEMRHLQCAAAISVFAGDGLDGESGKPDLPGLSQSEFNLRVDDMQDLLQVDAIIHSQKMTLSRILEVPLSRLVRHRTQAIAFLDFNPERILIAIKQRLSQRHVPTSETVVNGEREIGADIYRRRLHGGLVDEDFAAVIASQQGTPPNARQLACWHWKAIIAEISNLLSEISRVSTLATHGMAPNDIHSIRYEHVPIAHEWTEVLTLLVAPVFGLLPRWLDIIEITDGNASQMFGMRSVQEIITEMAELIEQQGAHPRWISALSARTFVSTLALFWNCHHKYMLAIVDDLSEELAMQIG
ncbi:MAG: hypothetical protein JWP89_4386 [Schlesneria sp.]|nr:hypothetical protein [Schlesneria sp.]